MTKAAYPFKLPHSIKHAAQRLAKEDGVSLNQWIAVAMAEKIGAMETAKAFLQGRANGAKPSDMLAILDRAGNEAPQSGDAILE